MATITGGQFRNPRTGSNASVRIVAPVVKQFEFATRTGKDSYQCLGVVGNIRHLMANPPGDHTWYSTHSTFRQPGGATIYPKRGWVYAGDWHVPEMATFERWLLARLRKGVYVDVVKYFNILNRHWNRKQVRHGKMFAYATYSKDPHLHLSWMPGAEFAIVDLFGDYEHFRTTGRNEPVPAKPAPSVAVARAMDIAAARLPVMRRGRTGRAVRVAQACLVARQVWPCTNASARRHITGEFGAETQLAIKNFQKQVKLAATGVVDARTWSALTPDKPATVIRGSDGWYVSLMQCLLLARGFDPGVIDGEAGDNTIAALKRFQVDAGVKNSVVRGRGDGIAGTATWVALVTF